MTRFRFVVGIGCVLAACSEHLPRPFDDDAGPAPVVDAGPDAGDDDAGDAGPDCTPLANEIDFAPIATGLTAPVESVLHDGHIYVLEQGGRVLEVDDANVAVVLDVSSIIVSGGEAGLLGIAFHPKFATNGFVYLYYTIPTAQQPPPTGVVFQSLLVRYHSADNGRTLDPASAHPILTVDQPFTNHNGATIAFGPDGYLYWGLGDGGSGGDPMGNGQDKNVLLGKMLRLDVDAKDPYAIPATNPFANEVFAYGLRNPYRWRFDGPTLWVGDVGQGAREEIDRVTLGGNFGWNVREGKICYNATTCATDGFIDPVVDHDRSEATTIIGGVVYRGAALPELAGHYVYGDFGLKRYYTFGIDDASPIPAEIPHAKSDILPTSFTLDAAGEIVVTDYNGGLYRVVRGTTCP